MFKMFYLIIAVTLLYAQSVVATEYNTTDDIRERCATCIAHFSSQNVNLNAIEMYEGFEGFLIKYDAIQQYGVEDPELICLLTDMCSFNDEEEEPRNDLTDTSNFDGQYYDNDLVVQEELNGIGFKMFNLKCSACKQVFQWVLHKIDGLADKRRTNRVVRGLFSKGCQKLLHIQRSSCTTLIKKNSDRLVKMALKRYAPNRACKLAKACK